MKNLQDIVQGKNIKGMAIGLPKSGKTVGLTSFSGKIMVFDLDKRIDPVLKMRPERKNIFFEQYDSIDHYELFEQDVNRHLNDRSFNMYILDSITRLGDMVMTYSMKLRGVGEKARTGKSKGVIISPEVEDFGAESDGLKKIINAFLEVDHAHVFVTAHVLKSTAFDIVTNKETIHSTILTGGKKIAAKLPTLFNEIWSFSHQAGLGPNDPGKFIMSTTPTTDVPNAGSALPIPTKIDFTMPKFDLWSQIEASLTESKRKVEVNGTPQADKV